MTTSDPKGMAPMELDQAAKKKVLRDFTYGLYAVTAAHDGERGVFTANWLSQASFEPPLVMLSVENDSSTLPLIRASGRFAICPLDENQKALAGALGRPKARAGDKYATLDLATSVTRRLLATPLSLSARSWKPALSRTPHRWRCAKRASATRASGTER
ncbi:MAG: flavin reductase domain protein FMN-binding protein [Thermomicrobiales bacterium]|nr:flavin reductase domain protein FMN-binding protein [Thermomicrobiales bacterium]